MFPLLTPVFPHQLLTAHNSSHLRFTTAAISKERWGGVDMENMGEQCGLCSKKNRRRRKRINAVMFLSSFVFLFLLSYLPDAPPKTTTSPCTPHADHSLLEIWPSWGGNRKYTPRLKGSFHSHTHSHTETCHGGLECKLPPHTPSSLFRTHAP